MKSQYKYFLPVALCAALAMTACSTANKDWANASTENTVAGYQAFLDKHAGDQHANEARTPASRRCKTTQRGRRRRTAIPSMATSNISSPSRRYSCASGARSR